MPIIPQYAYFKTCLCGRVGTIVLQTGDEIDCLYSKREALDEVASLFDEGSISEFEEAALCRQINESALPETEDGLSPEELVGLELCSTYPDTQRFCENREQEEEMPLSEYVM